MVYVETNSQGSISAEKDMESRFSKMIMSHEGDLGVMKVKGILDCVSRSIASRLRLVTLHLINHSRSSTFSLGSKSSGGS